MKRNKHPSNNIRLPSCWVLSWGLELVLGFQDGTYLPNKTGRILYPEYFDDEGNPILSKLPTDSPDLYKKIK